MNIAPFQFRVRILTLVKSGLIGVFAGGVVGTVVAALMVAKAIAADPVPLFACLGGGAFAGLLRGLLVRISEADLVRSIDRRADLEDRLTTSREVANDSTFAELLDHDARTAFAPLKPNLVFPLRWNWREAWVPVPAILAAGLFYFASIPVTLTAEQQQKKATMSRAAAQVERLSKPVVEPEPGTTLSPAEKALAKELAKLQQDLRANNLETEPALQKLNELSREADALSKNRGELALNSLADAQEALAKSALSELSKTDAAMSAADLKSMQARQTERASKRNELKTEEQILNQKLAETKQKLQDSRLTPEERRELQKQQEALEQALNENQAAQEQLQKELDSLTQSAEEMNASRELLENQESILESQKSAAEKKLNEIKRQLQKDSLSPEQRKALEEAQRKLEESLKGLEKELAEVREAIQELMNNEKIREMMEKLNSHPEMEKLREMMAEMQKNADAEANGEPPTLSKEDLEAMKEQIAAMKAELEELAKQLEDPEALEAYLKALEEAIKNQQMGAGLAGLGMGLPGLMSVPGMPFQVPGGGMFEEDRMMSDSKTVNKSDRDKSINAKVAPGAVKGRRSENGTESYIEVRGPTSVGNRTSVPYRKVLPNYQQRAEQAMKNRKIPKQHEKRVKAYFDSLAGKK